MISYETFSPSQCHLCPRSCNADRTKGKGFCGASANLRLARAALHHWEEPCITGQNGSGAIFFSGCPLKCIFCQNHEISHETFGKEIPVSRLTEIMEELQAQGAHNINLVTATPYIPHILEALQTARLHIPILYNTGGYERMDTLRKLEGKVSVYMPDFKFWDNTLAREWANASDYREIAQNAILEMYRQVGSVVMEDGLLKRGVLIRHLVMPGHRQDSMQILDWIKEQFGNHVLISLMSQYTPTPAVANHKILSRRVTTYEYEQVVAHADTLGLEGYRQERTSAQAGYTPSFSLEGV